MKNLKERLIQTTEEIDGIEYTRLNMPLKKICHELGAGCYEVFTKLNELDIQIEHPILLSQQDIDDYKKYEKRHPWKPYRSPKEELELGIHTLIANMRYFDRVLKGNDGKVGLIDTLGNVVVPPMFDSAEGVFYLSDSNHMAIVGKDGKFWLTPRDGSGRIVNPTKGYDSVKVDFQHAFVVRDGKHGVVDMETGSEMIPSKMDWLNKVISDFVFGCNGKIGYYRYYEEDDLRYTPPVYDAFNLTTHQVKKNGEWGWELTDNSFYNETPLAREAVKEYVWNVENYIEDNPINATVYYTLDELRQNLKKDIRKIAAERQRTPVSLLKLPLISFPKGFKAIPEIEQPMQNALRHCLKNKVANYQFWFGLKDDCEQLVDITLSNAGKGLTLEISWTDTELERQWIDTRLPEKMMKSLNVIVSASDTKPVITFSRKFEANQIKMAAKFITYFLTEFRMLDKNDIKAYSLSN